MGRRAALCSSAHTLGCHVASQPLPTCAIWSLESGAGQQPLDGRRQRRTLRGAAASRRAAPLHRIVQAIQLLLRVLRLGGHASDGLELRQGLGGGRAIEWRQGARWRQPRAAAVSGGTQGRRRWGPLPKARGCRLRALPRHRSAASVQQLHAARGRRQAVGAAASTQSQWTASMAWCKSGLLL